MRQCMSIGEICERSGFEPLDDKYCLDGNDQVPWYSNITRVLASEEYYKWVSSLFILSYYKTEWLLWAPTPHAWDDDRFSQFYVKIAFKLVMFVGILLSPVILFCSRNQTSIYMFGQSMPNTIIHILQIAIFFFLISKFFCKFPTVM